MRAWLISIPIAARTRTGAKYFAVWNEPLNWLGGVPNAAGAEVNFWRTITADRTISLDGSKTLGKLSFDSPFSYTIGPGTGGSLIFNNSGSAATLKFTAAANTRWIFYPR